MLKLPIKLFYKVIGAVTGKVCLITEHIGKPEYTKLEIETPTHSPVNLSLQNRIASLFKHAQHQLVNINIATAVHDKIINELKTL